MTLARQEDAPSQQFIVRSVDGTQIVLQRITDGYINATALAKAFNKLLADYLRLTSTNAYFSALEADMGIPITELVQVRRGGSPQEQGTWVHPHIATHLAQWASPTFAVQVNKWVYEWMRGELVEQPKPSDNPFHLIIRQAEAALGLEKRQMVLDTRITTVERGHEGLNDRMEALEAKIESVAGGPDCYTIKGYAKIQGAKIPLSLAQTLGQQATRMCKEKGWPVGTARDEVHGTINTYPEEILSILFFHHGLLKGSDA